MKRVLQVLILGLVTAFSVSLVSAPTLAFWTDQQAVTTGSFTAYTVPKPVITSCVVTGVLQKTATITFTTSLGPTGANDLVYSAVVVETGNTVPITGTGNPRTAAFSAGLLSTVLNQTYNVRIRATLPAPNTSWVSLNANQPVTIGLLGLSLTCGTAT